MSIETPTVRETAAVTVKEPVDGTRKRKARGPGARRAITTHHVRPRADVWAEARRICLSTQRLVTESHTSVLVVNR